MATDVPDWAKDTSSSVPDWAKESTSPKLFSSHEKPDVSAEEKLGALARGLPEGIIGGLGGIEGFFTQTIPQLAGFEGASKTLLPTSDEIEGYVQSAEKKLGMQPGVKPEVEGYRQGSAAVGEAVTPVGAIGTVAAKTIAPLRNVAKGKDLEKALKIAGGSIEDLAKQASERISSKESESIADLIRRAGQRRVNLTDAEIKRAAEIQSIREADALSYADLGKPSSTAKLGDEMQRRLTGTEFTRGAVRSQRAKEDSANYFKQAAEKDWGKSAEFGDVMMTLQEMMRSGKYNPDERKIAAQMFQELQTTKDIQGVEKIFRKYNEASKGLPKEGYDAVTQQFSGSVSKMLSDALNDFAPARKEFRNTYQELSTPLDVYETSFGSKGVAKEKAVPDQLQMMPTDYPNRYFQNRDTVRVLREQLAGDEAAVRKFANQHVVNELQGKNAKQAQDWLTKNMEWVDEVPGLNDRVKRYVGNLTQSEAKVGTLDEQINRLKEVRQKVGKKAETAQENISKLSTEQQKFVNDSMVEFRKANSAEVPSKAENLLSGLLKREIINPQEYNNYIDQINNIRQAATSQKQAAQKITYLITGGLAAFAPYGVRKALGY